AHVVPAFCYRCAGLSELPSFPTRRSSDLLEAGFFHFVNECFPTGFALVLRVKQHVFDMAVRHMNFERVPRSDLAGSGVRGIHRIDRKSTRLNSSHVKISYAVFCLKKKRTN